MGKTPAAVREKARAARMRLDANRDARDKRVETYAAAILVAQEAAAAAGRALKAAQTTHDQALADADGKIGSALVALGGEGLRVSDMATLTDLSEKDVRRLSRIGAQAQKAARDVGDGGMADAASTTPVGAGGV